MARQPRLVFPDTALHIVQRGHDRRPCFRDETDYLVYLSNVRDLARTIGFALHAYCLMTNHVHLLITPSDPKACSRLMRHLGQRYVQYFNRRHRRSGTLWEGRFRSCLVDSARYVLACYRYVEMNPVRAGIVSKPIEYAWSSHAGNSGQADNRLLTPHAEYAALAADRDALHAAYRGLFVQPEDSGFLTGVRDATNGGFALVGEKLRSSLPIEVQQRLERKRPGPRPQPCTPERKPDIQEELGLRPRTG